MSSKFLKDIVIVGASANGQAGVVKETIDELGGYTIVGFLDKNPKLYGKLVLGVPVLGSEKNIKSLKISKCSFHIAIGNNTSRIKLYNFLKKNAYNLETIIHPLASISKDASIGEGSYIGVNAVIKNGVSIGHTSIINTSAVVEHDNKIGNSVHIGPGAITGGQVQVSDLCLIGLGARILPGISLGSESIIGAGAIITRNVKSKITMIGSAAKPLK